MECSCCGCGRIEEKQVLWPELVAQWGLAPDEVAYIDRQQGTHCVECGSNLRSMALARAILSGFGHPGSLLEFLSGEVAQGLHVLEINEAGRLTPFLRRLAHHTLVKYPDVDMMALPFADGAFDLVVHSDTLEHVPDPVRGLEECRRVLRPGGYCAFTVPIVVARLTRSRDGLPPSYHGSPDNPVDCTVRTEYGADAWTHVMLAGFQECRIFSMEFPAAQALVGVR
jgi:SAM-dependent methyltransferase